MNQNFSLFIIVLGIILGGTGLWITINHLSPYGINAHLGITAFYTSAGVFTAGILTLFNYFLRLGKKIRLIVLMRQGIILSLLVLSFLFLQHLQVLTWWDGLLLVGIALLIEFLFSSCDERVI